MGQISQLAGTQPTLAPSQMCGGYTGLEQQGDWAAPGVQTQNWRPNGDWWALGPSCQSVRPRMSKKDQRGGQAPSSGQVGREFWSQGTNLHVCWDQGVFPGCLTSGFKSGAVGLPTSQQQSWRPLYYILPPGDAWPRKLDVRKR